jgi:dTDP-4-dehydrorhamnose 3,5-epimerase
MASRFNVLDTPLQGLRLVERMPTKDTRGYFERLFCETDLIEVLDNRAVSQINCSVTRDAGAVRGLHFQVSPCAETKLVSCTRGEIFDVAVDLRGSSETFLQWFGVKLSEENSRSLLIPGGFAHGFQVMSPDSQVLYVNTAPYSQVCERVINALDPRIAISWPLAIGLRSERDVRAPMLEDNFPGLLVE